MIEFVLIAVYWLLVAVTVVAWGGIAICWLAFAYAWCRGELHDDSTPASILDGSNRRAAQGNNK